MPVRVEKTSPRKRECVSHNPKRLTHMFEEGIALSARECVNLASAASHSASAAHAHTFYTETRGG